VIDRQAIEKEARTWVGVRFRDKGRTREGIDCVGLPFVTLWALGVDIPNVTGYPSRPNGEFKSYFDKRLAIKSVSEALPGDLLLFAEGPHLCHCGIVSTLHGKPAVIHAALRYRKTVEQSLVDVRSVMGPPLFCYDLPGAG
jgi:cell wall-associated NlpC family hydrolase